MSHCEAMNTALETSKIKRISGSTIITGMNYLKKLLNSMNNVLKTNEV